MVKAESSEGEQDRRYGHGCQQATPNADQAICTKYRHGDAGNNGSKEAEGKVHQPGLTSRGN